MKALITGGSGFIGSNVTKKVLSEGCEARILDNLSSGYRSNLDGLDIEFIEGDVTDSETVEKACRGVDAVFHLAASVGRQRSIDFPQVDSMTNLIGTINVLEGMRKNGVSKIVYSSSAAIFGELETYFIDETHPQNADSPYGVSKLAAEKMILAFSGIYKEITGVCLRYFNIYGVNQCFDLYGNVIPIFAKRLYSGEPLTIYGDGEQTRDFVNVHDVAMANFLGMQSSKTDVYNIGSGTSVTINSLAKLMQKISGIQTEIKYAPERPADVRHCRANAQKALDGLGFKASVDLETGLDEYLKWFKDSCKIWGH
ncbi:MAG: NAD-dependent epimerase/dehydratase family protein [Thermoguttaceae bacterium]|nr:NAD-dependent epimerase/dehydratase family protein [Thermoguttaceae bacterium]